MEGSETVKVSVVIDPKPKVIPCSNTFTAEELCTLLCKQYKIPPLTRTLFALRVKVKVTFLKITQEFYQAPGIMSCGSVIRFVNKFVYLNRPEHLFS